MRGKGLRLRMSGRRQEDSEDWKIQQQEGEFGDVDVIQGGRESE